MVELRPVLHGIADKQQVDSVAAHLASGCGRVGVCIAASAVGARGQDGR